MMKAVCLAECLFVGRDRKHIPLYEPSRNMLWQSYTTQDAP